MAGSRYIDLITDAETLANVTNQRAMVRRLVNMAVAAVAAAHDWPFLWTESFFAAVASYTTGTVSVTNGSATITGTNTVWTAAMVGRKFRAASTNAYYTIITFTSGTSVTLGQPYQGTTNTAASYTIFQDVYPLRADVDKQKRIRQMQFGVGLVPVHVSLFDSAIPTPTGLGPANFEIKVGRNVSTYTTGTVSMTSGSRTLTGAGSPAWTTVAGLGRGTKINIGQVIFTANTVDSDTQITTYEAATSAIAAGTSYTAILDNPLVQLYSIPNTQENYFYRFGRIPAVLDADGDIPDLLAPMHPLILRWVIVWLQEQKGLYDRAIAARRLYDQDLQLAIQHYGSDHQDRIYPRLPSDIQRGTGLARFPDTAGTVMRIP